MKPLQNETKQLKAKDMMFLSFFNLGLLCSEERGRVRVSYMCLPRGPVFHNLLFLNILLEVF